MSIPVGCFKDFKSYQISHANSSSNTNKGTHQGVYERKPTSITTQSGEDLLISFKTRALPIQSINSEPVDQTEVTTRRIFWATWRINFISASRTPKFKQWIHTPSCLALQQHHKLGVDLPLWVRDKSDCLPLGLTSVVRIFETFKQQRADELKELIAV